MGRWIPKLDITTVPDDVLFTESARRQRARQIDSPRPKVLRQCPHCLQPFGAREMRKHLPECPNRSNPIQSERAGWTVRKISDSTEQDARAYRYWQSLSVGERIIATWELTEAAYSIQKVG